MARSISAIIFDCDGVLVDSETLSASVLMGMMAEEGLPITHDMFRRDFLGRSFANAAARAEVHFGVKLAEDFQLRYRARLLTQMRRELKAMPHVIEMLDCLRAPYWLATSSSPQRLAVSLEVTDLERFFSGRCSTASEVAHGKPEPDLFYLAAQRLGHPPEACLVIEDSEMGVRAGLAAGMTVWHFTGGAHMAAGYHLPADVQPHRVVPDMQDLSRQLQALALSDEMGTG